MFFSVLGLSWAQAQTKPSGSVSEQATTLTRQMMADLQLNESMYVQLKNLNVGYLEALQNLERGGTATPASREAEKAKYEGSLRELLTSAQFEQYRQGQPESTVR